MFRSVLTLLLSASFAISAFSQEKDYYGGSKKMWPKEVSFGVEKGMRCNGTMHDGKAHKACEAGMRKNYTASFTEKELALDVSSSIHEQMHGILPDVEFFMPNVDELKRMFDGELLKGEDRVEMSFGGKAGIEFGCKVAFEKNKGEVMKKVECGMKMKVNAGKAEDVSSVVGEKQVLF